MEGKQQGSGLNQERRIAVISRGEQRRPPGANGQTSGVIGYGDFIHDKGAQHVMFIYTIRFILLYIAMQPSPLPKTPSKKDVKSSIEVLIASDANFLRGPQINIISASDQQANTNS